jgi:hypothetical protein
MTFMFDLPCQCLFRSQLIVSNPLRSLPFHCHDLSIIPWFIAGYNSFWEVFIIANVEQKFLTDGNATVFVILCQQTLKLFNAWLILS